MNTSGQQVVDAWAAADAAEWVSTEPRLVTNRRRPILKLVADPSGGVHDTRLAACDRCRYELLGCAEPHDNSNE